VKFRERGRLLDSMPSLRMTDTLKVPVDVDIPDSSPVELKTKPGGSELPVEVENV
jgi:hypothetical protein